MNEDAYRRAFLIITGFFESDDLPSDLRERILGWLADEHNRDIKDAALWRVFCKILDGDDPGVVIPESCVELEK